ncbi:MAG: DUF2157 domain-containing protein [Saprospirales bacterium]|nr:DUF2157 domain-containing protein [Saprospirales bacterium]MBK8489325.1 DUF2157 domain-containing protein [Saprospirales bacterium]
MNILKDIPELVKAEVISPETAEKIRDYYRNKGGQSTNRLFVVFGILGAVLIGLGIILIIAHNWDELSRTTKTFFAFLPLFAGQILCGFTLFKKPDSVAWRESSTAFLFFAVGASISLVSQVYNIPGNLSSFLLTWMLLCLPLVYVMKSSIASLLYLIGITYYAGETGYWSYPSSESYLYWILLSGCLPHYYLLYKNKPESNFMTFHNWLIPLSVIITLGTVSKGTKELMFIAYFSLFACFYLLGNLKFFTHQRSRNNGFKTLGALGTIVLLLALSFDWFWEDLRNNDFQFNAIITSPEFSASVILTILAAGLLFLQQKNKPLNSINPIAPVFILFIITFLLGLVSPISIILINLFVLAIGVWTIWDGAKQDHLGILNFGLLIIMALVVCRFFDEHLGFLIRGTLFVSVGIGFFATNYWMLKKRKTNE